jgi:hypothetical protein
MKNSTWNPDDFKSDLKQLTIKKYICDEINGQYIQSLYETNEVNETIKQLEERDEQMSRYIHTLLHRSNRNRYFFAIGAGI